MDNYLTQADIEDGEMYQDEGWWNLLFNGRVWLVPQAMVDSESTDNAPPIISFPWEAHYKGQSIPETFNGLRPLWTEKTVKVDGLTIRPHELGFDRARILIEQYRPRWVTEIQRHLPIVPIHHKI